MKTLTREAFRNYAFKLMQEGWMVTAASPWGRLLIARKICEIRRTLRNKGVLAMNFNTFYWRGKDAGLLV